MSQTHDVSDPSVSRMPHLYNYPSMVPPQSSVPFIPSSAPLPAFFQHNVPPPISTVPYPHTTPPSSPSSVVSYDSQSSDEPRGPPQACIFVASIPEDASEDSVRAHFSEFGVVLKAKVLKDKASRPYAFVQFQDIDAASEALRSTKLFDGRRIRMERAKVNRTLFLAKMNRSMTAQDIREALAPYGNIESVTIIKNHQTNRSKGCAFVKFQFREDALSAFTGLKASGRKWIVEWATSSNDPEALGLDKFSVFIGGLNPAGVTKEMIVHRFGRYGEIESVTLVNKSDDGSLADAMVVGTESAQAAKSAFAFVRYVNPASSIAAIEYENGAEWIDRRLRVQYCESTEMKSKRKQNRQPSPSTIMTYSTMPLLSSTSSDTSEAIPPFGISTISGYGLAGLEHQSQVDLFARASPRPESIDQGHAFGTNIPEERPPLPQQSPQQISVQPLPSVYASGPFAGTTSAGFSQPTWMYPQSPPLARRFTGNPQHGSPPTGPSPFTPQDLPTHSAEPGTTGIWPR
eukprot:TRINITY_DN7391_c0_g1_i5.p1 TRINITY_DN7391_c0_g1~~TRINITY_DN7391_c0_g1_i5.p1  ORF type:complete len:516 (-),score=22.36 TRINITY_DN7391_c0_g1_i5:71-1618(-)